MSGFILAMSPVIIFLVLCWWAFMVGIREIDNHFKEREIQFDKDLKAWNELECAKIRSGNAHMRIPFHMIRRR